MSRRDLSVEVSEGTGDRRLLEVTQDGTLAAGMGVGTLKSQHVLFDQVMKILLFQTNLNPQAFQLVLYKSQVIAGILTPPSHPG